LELSRILVGMADYDTGLDMDSFTVIADFDVNGVAKGQNLAANFKTGPKGVWELRLEKPILALANGQLTVSIKDRQGNLTKVERRFAVGNSTPK
jgi:hypothetical protein